MKMNGKEEKPIYEFWSAAQRLKTSKSKNSREALEKQILVAILEDRDEEADALYSKLKKREKFSVVGNG